MYFQEDPHDGGSRLSSSQWSACCTSLAQLSTLFPLIALKKIQSHRKKCIHILHIKLVIPSAVLKGQMQPNRSTPSSVHAAFCLAACACWGSSAERKSYCAPTDVPCQKHQTVKAQNHFVPLGAFPSLVSDHTCSTGNNLLPSWNK